MLLKTTEESLECSHSSSSQGSLRTAAAVRPLLQFAGIASYSSSTQAAAAVECSHSSSSQGTFVNCGRLATNCKLHRNAHERLPASQPQKPLVTGTRTSSALIILSDTQLTANNTVLRTRKKIYQDFSPAMKYDFCDYNLMVICD